MYNAIEFAKSKVREVINNSFIKAIENKVLAENQIPQFTVEIPAESEHGDFAVNAALVGAKAFRKAPKVIAEALCDNIILENTIFEKIEIAGPGFINFFIGKEWFNNVVKAVNEEKENYGKTSLGEGKKVLIEFVSANPTGPMHIGNARGGALGDCLASLLDYAGFNSYREFYINDAGNQIERFALSLEARYLQLFDDSIEMPENAYLGQDITNHAINFKEAYGDKYLKADSDERKNALVEFALPKNIQGIKDDLLKYRINYDNWFYESTLHNNGEVEKVIQLLKDNGHTYESEGALWLQATKFGADKDFVLVRSNGIPTYIVPDIAYHYNKLIIRGFDKAINVLGADHHGYKQRLDLALNALNIDTARLDVVICQMVRIMSGNEVIKLSKRSGKAITLSTLLEEVPIDAARLFFNLRDSNTHLDFDLELAVEESSKNPVFYVQYAHARICSIINKLENENIEMNVNYDNLIYTAPQEIEIIRHLAKLPDEINDAAREYNPSQVTKYTIELAQKFHKFYDGCRILGEEKNVINSRIALCNAVKIVFKNMLDLMKINAPEKM